MRATGVAVLAGVLLVAGCGGDDDPPALPPVTAPVTTSAVASPSASAFPETPQGASAFARFFFARLNQAFAKGDPSLVRPLLGQNCQVCKLYLDTLRDLESGQATVSSGGTRVLSAESPGEEGGFYVVSLRLKSGLVTFRDASGKITSTEAPNERQSEMRLTRTADGFVVAEIGQPQGAGS